MKIILVDDEQAVLDKTRSMLMDYNPSNIVSSFKDPRKALESSQGERFDCALLDIEMAYMNGIELAELLQKENPLMHIIFVTAYNTYATEAFERSAIDYVLKPIRNERLIMALNKVESMMKLKTSGEGPQFEISTFGRFIVLKAGRAVQWQRNKSEEIFAYLVENKGKPVHKDVLCELGWPDYDYKKALVNLQTTIYSIRKTLGLSDNSGIRIDYSNNSYTVDLADMPTDFTEFERLTKEAVAKKDIALFRGALRIYRKGEYLAENGWSWAEATRVSYRKRLLYAKQALDMLEQVAGSLGNITAHS